MNTIKGSPWDKQRDRKKSARCEDNPCSAMGSWNVK